jgi:hypothetical protein
VIGHGLAILGLLANGPTLAAPSPQRAPETGLPATLAGSWEVERVAVDRADQPHWKHRPDEPALMNRELVIDGAEARFSGGKEGTCKPAGWQRHTSTWGTLIAGGQLRGGGAAESDPTAADYGLKVTRKAPVTAYSFCGSPSDPKHPIVNANGWMSEPWLAAQGADHLVMHLDEQTLLVLARRKPDAKPVASFPCARATSPTEKAICGSFTLAGWDRSVALAWRQQSESGGAAVSDQKEWLRSRDTCGTDARCLEEKMSTRVSALRLP